MIFRVPEELDGITVKQFLRKHCGVSARTLAKLKHNEKGMTVGGKQVRSIDTLNGGAEITLCFPEDNIHIEAVPMEVEVAYEDSHVIIYNKPSGMPVHPVHEYKTNTLANFAAYYMKKMGESYAFRPVSRLDKDTSGLVLCAKDRYSADQLSGNNTKLYSALCEGVVTGSGTIDKPIRIKEGHSIQRETGDGGQYAVTHYRSVKHYGENYTLLEIWLETGRTHQIRVHFSSIGHPLAGDDMYGGSKEFFPRQCLHCKQVRFVHPETRKEITVIRETDFFEEMIKM